MAKIEVNATQRRSWFKMVGKIKPDVSLIPSLDHRERGNEVAARFHHTVNIGDDLLGIGHVLQNLVRHHKIEMVVRILGATILDLANAIADIGIHGIGPSSIVACKGVSSPDVEPPSAS